MRCIQLYMPCGSFVHSLVDSMNYAISWLKRVNRRLFQWHLAFLQPKFFSKISLLRLCDPHLHSIKTLSGSKMPSALCCQHKRKDCESKHELGRSDFFAPFRIWMMQTIFGIPLFVGCSLFCVLQNGSNFLKGQKKQPKYWRLDELSAETPHMRLQSGLVENELNRGTLHTSSLGAIQRRLNRFILNFKLLI